MRHWLLSQKERLSLLSFYTTGATTTQCTQCELPHCEIYMLSIKRATAHAIDIVTVTVLW